MVKMSITRKKMVTKVTNPLFIWDGTSNEDPRDFLKEYCKKWVYQFELGEETGHRHYQIKMSLKDKKRNTELGKMTKHLGVRWSPSSNNGKQSFTYVMKDATRISGPWTDKDQEEPWHTKNIKILKYWQQDIWKSFDTPDARKINILIDEKGGQGKSLIGLKLMCAKKAMLVPYCNNYKDIMRMCYGLPEYGGYVIDLPRAIDKKNLHGLFAGIEDIKRGYLWDDRYKFKYKIIGAPVIWVFTNERVDLTLLTHDRWNIYEIDEEDNLKALAL